MEVRNWSHFLKVTELKSFSRAAEALDYSQSAVTVQIQQVERELGVQLFDRIGKNGLHHAVRQGLCLPTRATW